MVSASSKTKALDPPLHALGFEIDELSPTRVTGRLPVSPICCQVPSPSSILIIDPFFCLTNSERLSFVKAF